ncbi:hypothetical protein BRD14_00050 [Halobacteriales archaeon SW_5_68_122]|nr:MAG: hypothetical protein BRD14_00050 [Halobacteriales archaeon SW_5_68_122]
MDCRVVVEAAVPVYDVETADEAVRIAISKTGETHCDGELESAFIAADEGLVALELEMTVFNVERDEHASRVARKEIGQRLENIPLEVIEVEVVEADDEEENEETTEAAEESETSAPDDDEVLPEFEDLMDE